MVDIEVCDASFRKVAAGRGTRHQHGYAYRSETLDDMMCADHVMLDTPFWIFEVSRSNVSTSLWRNSCFAEMIWLGVFPSQSSPVFAGINRYSYSLEWHVVLNLCSGNW